MAMAMAAVKRSELRKAMKTKKGTKMEMRNSVERVHACGRR